MAIIAGCVPAMSEGPSDEPTFDANTTETTLDYTVMLKLSKNVIKDETKLSGAEGY